MWLIDHLPFYHRINKLIKLEHQLCTNGNIIHIQTHAHKPRKAQRHFMSAWTGLVVYIY